MKAAILSVGTELLLGDIVNTNAAFLSQQLAELGIACYQQLTVGDNQQRLAEAVERIMHDVELLIITGGLGPTADDLTKETIANMYQKCMILHEPSLLKMQKIFAEQTREMPGINLKQAMMPANTIVFPNDRGTAAGLAMTIEENKQIIMLPGPPREMEPMFLETVKPYLSTFTEETFVSETVHLFGIGESNAVEILGEELLAQANPTIAPYAKQGEMYFRITASGKDTAEATARIQPVKQTLLELFAPYVYGVNIDTLETAVMQQLQAHTVHVKITEFGTGGSILQRLASVDSLAKPQIAAASYAPTLPKMDGTPIEILQTYVGSVPEMLEIAVFYNHEQAEVHNPGTVYYVLTFGTQRIAQEVTLRRNYKNDDARMQNMCASHIFADLLKNKMIK